MIIDTRLGGLFVERRGDGPPLLLWPSLLCDGGMWRRVLEPLAERFDVINVDGPGHGRSAKVRRAFSLEDCAEAAVAVLDALSVERAHVAGLSWGGMMAMRLALAFPERVDRLALLDTSAAPEVLKKRPAYHAMTIVARRVGAIPLLLDRIEPIFFTRESVQNRREIVDPFREHLAAMDPQSIGHCVDAVIFDRRDLRPQLHRITAPTLVIVGAEDKATPVVRATEIADGIDGARLAVIEGAAHLSVLEQPEAILERLLEHLD